MKYQLNPVIVDAIQWDATTTALAQIKSLVPQGSDVIRHAPNDITLPIIVMTSTGQMMAHTGDWIVVGSDGLVFVIPNAAFPILFSAME